VCSLCVRGTRQRVPRGVGIAELTISDSGVARIAALEEQAPRVPWILHPVLDGEVPRYRLRVDGLGPLIQDPLAFLAHTDIADAHAAGRRLGLSSDDILRLMSAAGDFPGHDPTLRQRLLQAVGLERGGYEDYAVPEHA
jgi:hypothetical protein